jgi:predicted RNA-binding protein YlxR (DUF448 family)
VARKQHVPERSCVACAKKVPKQELVRVVRTPEGEVAVDLTGKASGRGAYLCQSADCWDRAVCRGGLARSLKAEISNQDRDGIRAFYQESIVRESIAKD